MINDIVFVIVGVLVASAGVGTMAAAEIPPRLLRLTGLGIAVFVGGVILALWGVVDGLHTLKVFS